MACVKSDFDLDNACAITPSTLTQLRLLHAHAFMHAHGKGKTQAKEQCYGTCKSTFKCYNLDPVSPTPPRATANRKPSFRPTWPGENPVKRGGELVQEKKVTIQARSQFKWPKLHICRETPIAPARPVRSAAKHRLW